MLIILGLWCIDRGLVGCKIFLDGNSCWLFEFLFASWRWRGWTLIFILSFWTSTCWPSWSSTLAGPYHSLLFTRLKYAESPVTCLMSHICWRLSLNKYFTEDYLQQKKCFLLELNIFMITVTVYKKIVSIFQFIHDI